MRSVIPNIAAGLVIRSVGIAPMLVSLRVEGRTVMFFEALASTRIASSSMVTGSRTWELSFARAS